MEKEAPKLCNRLQSRLNSWVYPNSAKRPSSWILKLTSEEDILGWGRCSVEDLHLLAMGTERTWLLVRLTEYVHSGVAITFFVSQQISVMDIVEMKGWKDPERQGQRKIPPMVQKVKNIISRDTRRGGCGQ